MSEAKHINEAGLVIVPREPTDRMKLAGGGDAPDKQLLALAIWRAMVWAGEMESVEGKDTVAEPEAIERSQPSADRIEALEAEAARLRAALKAIAVRAGTFEGRGSYIAYVALAGEIERMADAARNGEEP